MALEANVIRDLIKKHFSDADLQLEDLTGNQNHYELSITSSSFNGLSKVMQHKLVYDALQGYIGNEIHAISIKTMIKE